MQRHLVTGRSVFHSPQTLLPLLPPGHREEVDPLRWRSPPALAHSPCRVTPQTRHRTDDGSPGGSEGLRRTAVGKDAQDGFSLSRSLVESSLTARALDSSGLLFRNFTFLWRRQPHIRQSISIRWQCSAFSKRDPFSFLI